MDKNCPHNQSCGELLPGKVRKYYKDEMCDADRFQPKMADLKGAPTSISIGVHTIMLTGCCSFCFFFPSSESCLLVPQDKMPHYRGEGCNSQTSGILTGIYRLSVTSYDS